jgi:uncharacterized protein (TIGR02145 family)
MKPIHIINPLFSCLLCFLTCDRGNPADDSYFHEFGSMTDTEGIVYKTIQIGNQVWMAENLRSTKYNDGTAIPLVTDNAAWGALTTPGYCYYNNTTDSDSIMKYGALYNWYTVNTGKLAPSGWHVPDSTDWNILINYLIANEHNWDGTTTGNKIAKSMASKSIWYQSGNAGAVGNDVLKNNKSGFSALPGGYRMNTGFFSNLTFWGYWWSATEDTDSTANCHALNFDYPDLIKRSIHKGHGMSVRLVKD